MPSRLPTPYERQLHDNGLRLPCILQHIRTEKGRRHQRDPDPQFWSDGNSYLAPRADGVCNTLTSTLRDNLIMLIKQQANAIH